MILLLLAAASVGSHTPPHRSASAAHRQQSASSDATAFFVRARAMNLALPGVDLHSECATSSFKTLAYSLDGLRDRISLSKDEFETEGAFAKRQDSLKAALNGDTLIIVCQPLADNEDLTFTYDADNQTFTGSFSGKQNVWRDVRKTGSYSSRTRMDVRATVSLSLDIEFNVDMANSLLSAKPKCLADHYGQYGFSLKVDRSAALSLKAQGYFAFVGRLTPPFVRREDSSGAPTLDNPHDIFERALTVSFAPQTMYVVDGSGKVVWSCDAVPSDKPPAL